MIKSTYYLAKTYFLLGDSDKAIFLAQPILEKYQDANILMAEVLGINLLTHLNSVSLFHILLTDLSFQKRSENINGILKFRSNM
jgi:hypothetical protein